MAAPRNHRKWAVEWLAPLLVAAVVIPLSLTGPGRALENLTVDWRFLARSDSDPAPDPRICIVGIGEAGLQKFGQWPWSRAVHATFAQYLQLRPPTVVAFDLLFTEPARDPADDAFFGESLGVHVGSITGAAAEEVPVLPGDRREREVFTGGDIGNTRPLPHVTGDISILTGLDQGIIPIPPIREGSYTGFVNMNTARERTSRGRGGDVIRRAYPLVVRVGEDVYPSLALQTIMQFAFALPEQVTVELGNQITVEGDFESYKIPINDEGQLQINYRSILPFREPGPNNITYFSLYNFLELAAEAYQKGETYPWREDIAPIEGQILLIGQTALGLSDIGPTPLDPESPLVFQQAEVINSILKSDYLEKAERWPVWLGWLLVCFATLYISGRRLQYMLLVPLITAGLYIFAAFSAFHQASLQFDLFWPVVGFINVHSIRTVRVYLSERAAKRKMRGIFGTFCPPEIVDQIEASGKSPELGGEVVQITAFFSDIQAFSAFSEKLSPQELVSLMNEYLGEMEQILKNVGGGTVDKFIGDAIVGMFGAPVELKEHAWRACATAIEMHQRQAQLREKWRDEGHWPQIVTEMQTRIGLNTGEATVGYMGSESRKNYTMMGDMVNLAARCESGAKSYGVYTMITAESRDAAKAHRDDIAYRYLDKIIVKGRVKPVEVYEVVGFREKLPASIQRLLDLYAEAMGLYLDRQWDEARARFEAAEALEQVFPGRTTNPSKVMIQRAEFMKAEPPPEDWDGVWVMTSK